MRPTDDDLTRSRQPAGDSDAPPDAPIPPEPLPDSPTQVMPLPPAAGPPSSPTREVRAASAAAVPAAVPGRATSTLVAIVALVLVIVVAAVLGYGIGLLFRGPAPIGGQPLPTDVQTIAPGASPASPGGEPGTDAPSPASVLPGSPDATASSAAPPTPDADPQARLMSHIPPALRSGCRLEEASPPALAVASCPADAGKILATYFLYADGDTMATAYDRFVAESGIDRDSGRCSQSDTWPSEGSYSILGEQRGRVLCMEFTDAPTIYWTDDELNILTWAFHFDGDAERLFEFWQLEAGPGDSGR